ncbi:MAG: hypothetical protein O6931_01795 [Gammaproteobacteria bacterium]|nr:hypothetical protein [Gammaproteobacteria bacterium]
MPAGPTSAGKSARHPLHLVDASIYIFRAWFSLPDSMTDGNGQPVNAVYGFSRFLGELLQKEKPAHIGIAFDESLTSSFRNEIYPEYKANREPAPEELKNQFSICKAVAVAMGLPVFSSNRYEADDIIGSIAAWWRERDGRSIFVTRDKDLAQLLRPGDEYWDFAGRRRLQYEGIKEYYGVHPEQIADFLALTGDSVDNIRGVPGVGAKTAEKLLDRFADLEALYADLDQVQNLSIRGTARIVNALTEHREAAFFARRLTRIACDMDLELDEDSLRWSQPDTAALDTIYGEAGFGPALAAEARKLAKQFQ